MVQTRSQSKLLVLIGQRVRQARQAMGFTQEELAWKICLTRPSIANLERGDQDMPITRLALIAHFLGVDLADLVRGGEL